MSVLFLTTQAVLLGVMFGLLFTVINSFQTYDAQTRATSKEIMMISVVNDDNQKDEMARLAKKYKLKYETLTNKYFQTTTNLTENKINVFARTRHDLFNLDEFVAGSFPQNKNEIAIGSGFANKNNVRLNDTMTLADKEYKVVGLYQHPSEYQLYDLTKSTDISLEHNLPLIVADIKDIATDKKVTKSYYAKVARPMIKKLLIEPNVVAIDEINLDILQMLVSTNSQILYVSGMLILFIILISIFLQIKSLIQNNLASFGVLISMGVKKRHIVFSYASIGVFISMFTILGFEIGKRIATLYFQQIEATYNMVIPIEPLAIVAEIAIVVGLGLFIIFSTFIYVAYMIRRTPLLMITNSDTGKSHNKVVEKFRLRGLPFGFRMQMKNTIGNSLTTVLIVTSIFAAIFLFQFSFSLNSAMDGLISDYDAFIKFAAKSYYDMRVGNDDKAQFFETKIKMMDNLSSATDIDESIVLQAIDLSHGALNFKNQRGEQLQQLGKDELIVSSKNAEKYNLHEGDRVSLSIEGEKIEANVVFINNVYLDEYLYVSKETMNDVLQKKYGAVFSNGSFKREKDANFIIAKNQLLEVGDKMSESIQSIIFLLVTFACVLFCTTIVLFSNFIIQKHNKEITLLIAEGYSKLSAVRIFVNYFNLLIIFSGVMLLFLNNKILANLSHQLSEVVGYKLIFLGNAMLVGMTICAGIVLYNVYLFLYYKGSQKQNLERILKMEE